MSEPRWEFWIDVGGTFTDCLGRSPDGRLVPHKILSSGVTKGCLDEQLTPSRFVDPARRNDPHEFWMGYDVRLLDDAGQVLLSTRVTDFDARTGRFTTAALMPFGLPAGTRYELQSSEEAPVVAIRYLLELRLDQPIPDVVVRLGTTRGTNALLTRRGAKVGFVTTRGFRDILLIANQDRPRLFDLAIKKPEPIFSHVIEIDERVAADGSVLQAPNPDTVRRQLAKLRSLGIESIAICLLHGFAFPDHEQIVERLAREAGFTEVSTSSRLAPLIKIVSRGDTTVLDAYLNPVLRAYVASLRQSLDSSNGQASGGREAPGRVSAVATTGGLTAPARQSLKLMTSAGGLVDADRFVGKDSILSGPAGGVIGFSRVAQRAGFTKAIGFDMGGTSTDVSRFDGRYEMEFETKKAGVRVVAPMLAIETVAAGGGSICGFDGVKLTVGPDSAGANPGPACYGRGGPLTITDVNLFLGKIPPERFPFPLQREPVEIHLRRLCDEIASLPTGTKFEPHELAEGFVRVANANMVRPIRGISVAKGYDPRDYVLVTFGGAGAQHACAIARELGMRHVLSHPLAGLLSAYGIGLADVRRFVERAVLKPHSPAAVSEIEPLFTRLEQQARDAVVADGVATENIEPPQRSLDLRYQGVEATINVPRPDDGDFLMRYEQLHQQLYGYRHTGRGIEIVNARVEVVGRMPEPPDDAAPLVPRHPQPANRTRSWFDGQQHDTAVFLRDDLHPGDEIEGPAIVCEPSSTVVVDPGCTAKVLARGEVLIEVNPSASPLAPWGRGAGGEESPARESAIAPPPHPNPLPQGERGPQVADPILLEIFNNLFASIAEQMGITLQRTALSTNVKERLDFSCAIFTPTGELVVNAPHIPVHLGAMGETVRRIIADNSPHPGPLPKGEGGKVGIHPGDVFVTNDPYRGGSHLPDVTVVTPVHDPAMGELLFFTASRAHHAEIGGIVPGSMPPFSKCLGDEGVLIRNFKLVDAGRSREDDLRTLLESGPHPSRAVKDNLADVAAQVAANNSGVRRLTELVERYSLPVVQAYMKFIQQAAEHKMRRALAAIPDGRYSFTDHLDDGSPIAVTITITGEEATVDFNGTGRVLAGNLNANRAIVTAAVLYVFRCLINEDIPLNNGVLAPVRIVLPECLLNPPDHPDPAKCAAIVGGNVETSQRVVDTLLGALGVAAASQGTMNNLTFGDDSFGYYETICGGSGATRDANGADAVHTHMTNTRLTDPEVLERRYPVRLWEFSIRRGSGGAGKRRGGDGVTRRIEFLRPLRLSILSERRGPYAPFGLENGRPGDLGRNSIHRAGASDIEDCGGKVQTQVQAGDLLTIETPGGGGFGREQ